MQREDLPLLWAWLIILILVFAVPFAVLAYIPRFYGGVLFFTLLGIAQIAFVAVFAAKSWKGVPK